jgi:Ankyrin repeats (many copies)
MARFAERMADALSAIGLWGALCFVLSLALIAIAVWRFWLNPQASGLKNYGAWAGWLVACLVLLFLSDYLLHHAFIVFVLFSTLWVLLAIVEPHFGMGIGLTVLAVLSALVVSSFKSFIDNDLIRAIQKGRVEAAMSLIQAGANVNVQEAGYTALQWATRLHHEKIVAMLRNAGAIEEPVKTGDAS